jgi:hypothetical protein
MNSPSVSGGRPQIPKLKPPPSKQKRAGGDISNPSLIALVIRLVPDHFLFRHLPEFFGQTAEFGEVKHGFLAMMLLADIPVLPPPLDLVFL